LNDPTKVKILDFGCGRGSLVNNLKPFGYEVFGCDIEEFWRDSELANTDFFGKINLSPYQLPFSDNYFDVVISTSVLEHAQNTKEVFLEIKRVLKPNGVAMHMFGAKWYLPVEPHIYVPFANYFWPKCPRWWFKAWAILGVRNEYQKDLSWRQTAELNYQFCVDSLAYYTNKFYRKLSGDIFGDFQNPMIFYVKNSGGGVSKIARYLPFLKFWGWVSSNFRMNFILMRKNDKFNP
jgi:SAM-dependent methyltransferase